MVLEVKIDHLRAEKMKVKHQSVFFGTPCSNNQHCSKRFSSIYFLTLKESLLNKIALNYGRRQSCDPVQLHTLCLFSFVVIILKFEL